MTELAEAERALHDRTRLSGAVEAWEEDGLLAVRADSVKLRFLNTINGVTERNLAAAIRLAASPRWRGGAPVIIVPPGLDTEVLPDAGFVPSVPSGHRLLATRPLEDVPPPDPGVAETLGTGLFLKVLLDGYQSTGAISRLIAVEHSAPGIRRFLLGNVAAAALSVHGTTAVLGGAATLPEHRGEGAQRRLLAHRVAVAAGLGCRLAVATAAPDSPSAANLARSGFRLHLRPAWTQP
ncbi:GNAT family N-acetyltransferase [Amycolatopsis sp. H20-H5]|uniref:GNAT family N-acetyltransferase n=1 Tax=Amycolatopsis sp. H20-H5 TaxID=3046309 RepID=UPI002DBC35C4|nr:GNAT family N-acetyltransferase [Amycolatopsis sp. H20-H5]MEC3977410.1 GNAT family N-acetyltransferase [Amycolatopsis sp. H20-H5]